MIYDHNFVSLFSSFQTKGARNLTSHKKRKHLRIKDEICHICGKEFFDMQSLKKHHDQAHSGNGSEFVCDKCGSSYATSVQLKQHVSSKHPVYYLCGLCEEMFQSTKSLTVHMHKNHSVMCDKKNFYVCWKCHKFHGSSKELDDHLRLEHEMSKLEHRCQLCSDKTFSSKIILKMHVVETHDLDFTKASNSPFISQLFNVIKEANVTSLHSTGVQCPICQRMFSSNRSLADHHRQIHDKANHIKCDHCPYTTFQPFMMKRHILRKHTKTIKYQCELCSYFTYDVGSINVHKRRQHARSNAIKCSGCDKEFQKKKELAIHMLKAHNTVYQYTS